LTKPLHHLYFLLSALLVLASCSSSTEQEKKQVDASGFLNHHDSAKYVGINTCKQCHSNIYETFIKTGMGQSFEVASKQKSAAVFGKDAVVYDQFRNYYYHSFWSRDSMFIKEFRLQGLDTIYQRTEKVNYIIGSGQHTNSHMCIRNGYLTQMPMTFYTQKKQWDLPPGFENGANTRFSRNIGLECMSCHNSYPDFELGSENKYNSLPNGIGCERCHGPGSIHVANKMSGDIIDTSKYIDYSIVNPAKLSIDLQFDVCQRCHLQGNAVLKNDHSFYDFKPGMKLSDYISVFLPRYKNADDEFIMASHADRLKQSKCFIKTFDAAKSSKELRPYKNGLTCVSCHNPHVSVREKKTETFNMVCKKCHGSNDDKNCTLALNERQAKSNNCVSCHMPQSGSIDIPHVTVHDHWIRKPIKQKEINAIKEFIGLRSVNEKNPDAKTKAQAYLNYYEKFSKEKKYLDSAALFIARIPANDKQSLFIQINYWFFANEMNKIAAYVSKQGIEKVMNQLHEKRFDNKHAWTAYRIAEAYINLGDASNTERFLQKAISLAPSIPEFKNKLGAIYMQQNKIDASASAFQDAVNEQESYVQALSNLGYLQLVKGNQTLAEYYIKQAIHFDPDYEQAYLNLISLHLMKQEKAKAITIAKAFLKAHPSSEKMKTALHQIQ
jgi:predicted CXXCH cytochrome family protein